MEAHKGHVVVVTCGGSRKLYNEQCEEGKNATNKANILTIIIIENSDGKPESVEQGDAWVGSYVWQESTLCEERAGQFGAVWGMHRYTPLHIQSSCASYCHV